MLPGSTTTQENRIYKATVLEAAHTRQGTQRSARSVQQVEALLTVSLDSLQPVQRVEHGREVTAQDIAARAAAIREQTRGRPRAGRVLDGLEQEEDGHGVGLKVKLREQDRDRGIGW